MALTVQTNDGDVVGANAYTTLVEFKAYHDDRAGDYSSYTDANINAAIIRATDYIDQRFRYAGYKKQGRNQVTEFPRIDVLDRNERLVTGVPIEVKEANHEYAFRSLSATLNPDPDNNTGNALQSETETVGPISHAKKYVGGSVTRMPSYPAGDMKLRRTGLIIGGGTAIRG